MADKDATYCYMGLNPDMLEHRLLVLGGCDGPVADINCELIHARLKQQNHPKANQDEAEVPYEALSYVWGNLEPSAYIYLHGQRQRVTLELFQALKALRPLGNSFRLLWVDALCINQTDIQEQNHQVRLMGRIYSEASNVFDVDQS
jgi:hypothetical protein